MNRQLRVGIFVTLGLALMGVAIFLIGENRRFWEKQVTYRAAFGDVAGLKPGAPVRMGGFDVGTVTSVGHADSASDPRVYVAISIVKPESFRIRKDTVARVGDKGLLGDKLIELSVSEGKADAHDPKELLKSLDPEGLFTKVNRIAAQAEEKLGRLDPLLQTLSDPKLQEDLKGSVRNIREILDGIARSDSMAHKVIFDDAEGKKFSDVMTGAANASVQLNGILADAKDVSARARTGPGLVHTLVYDDVVATSVAGSMSEIHRDLKAVREGNGLAHVLLYGDDKDSQRIMGNLGSISDDLRTIIAGIRQGKGTIGGLLVDPSIYEDLKSAIGNVERNQVLRALVRYSIKQDESKPHVSTPSVPPQKADAPK